MESDLGEIMHVCVAVAILDFDVAAQFSMVTPRSSRTLKQKLVQYLT